VDADPSQKRGRPKRQAEAIDQAWRSTGIMGAACVQKVECATRETCAGGVETEQAERAWRAQESEGPIVPAKRVTTVEGRGPGSECFTRSGRVGDWREPENPNTAEELPGKLYAKAKAVCL
jgi:hypothetical protein